MVEVAGHLDPSLDGARLRRGGRRGEGRARSGSGPVAIAWWCAATKHELS